MNFLKKIVTNFLVFEARRAVKKFKPVIIGVTGSVGKSSTKEAAAAVLESRFSVRKSSKSYNSEIGVALAVLGLNTAWKNSFGWLMNMVDGFKISLGKKFPHVLVLEMGVDRPMDFDKLLRIATPSVGIITAIGEIPVHVEFFSGPDAVAKEKSKLIRSLQSDGTAILNFDDEVVWDLKDKTKAKILSFGFGQGADIRASNYKIGIEGIAFKVDYAGSSVPVRLKNVYGKQHVYASLAAVGVGIVFDMNLIEISEALQKYESPPGRLKLIEGIKKALILDDSYNASPLATHAALDTLSELEAVRKIVAFGDMLEIGKFTIEAHKAVGEKTAKVADYFVTVGPRSKFAAEGALAAGMPEKNIKSFSTSREAAQFVKELVKEGDIVLVKGSQSMRMERVSLELIAHSEDAEKLLVRQDNYWKNKE
ncbi:MAG: UDP-N-acetylmuramoyl-tripeptide--D-alanyl-D-alanine ligase [bacterium]|nr:UDP-N-acetylmuramoyl-tripeptide--D-alanyl-D-alanine ligase [bacterium]